MKQFTKHPSKVTAAADILSFKCPGCRNKTLYSAEQDVHRAADVDENELFICDECGGEFRAHPQYNGSIRFTESIESATSVDDKKIDRRLSSTSKRYKGYRISLDTQHECYNIYDPHGELEDSGFKSVDDAMAHIDELVSIESDTILCSNMDMLTKWIVTTKDYPWPDPVELEDDEAKLFDKLGWCTPIREGLYQITTPKNTRMKYVGSNGYWMNFEVEDTGIIVSFYFKRLEEDFDEYFAISKPVESATDVDEIPDFNDWLYDKYGVSDADMSDDDWEYYHDKYLKETGQEEYMSGNVYSSKQPGVRRKSTHHPVTAAKKRIARIGEWDNGHVIRNDWRSMSPEDAEEEARKQSLKDPEGTYYVAYDDVMNPYSPYSWKNGKRLESSTCISNGTCRETAAKSRTTRQGEFDDRRVRSKVDSSTDIDLSEYDYSGNVDGYFVYRKVVTQPDGSKKGMWVAQDQDEKNPPFSITYDQARGFDPINDTSGTKKLAKWLGKRLLPNSVEASDDIPHDGIFSAEAADDYEDDIQEISQEFTSENTSINSGKLPAIFKMVHLEPGTINIDYRGGKFDNVAEYLAPMDVVNLVYDPYNRTPEHNKEVLRTIRKAGGADSATCSNVLNVIKEPEVRRNVLENIRKVVKPEGVVYITVYEGSGRGDEGPTKSGYQLNRKTADYLAEVQEVFPDAIRKGKLIIAHPSGGAVESSKSVTSASSISMKAIHDKLLNAASKRMQKSDMGFPLSEIADYLIVEEEETEDGALKIEVRCELSYEGMSKLAEALDPIVARYDRNAYFDMVAPGIMEAFIFNSDIRADSFSPVTADNRNFPEPPLEPPNYDEPKQNNTTDYIVVDLDDDIIVEDNSIDFAADPNFYQESEEWVVEFATDTTLDDPDSVAEHVLELILPQIPDEPGMYRVKGRVTLAYDVSYSSIFRQEGYGDGYEDIDESSVDASFNFKKSEINKLEVGRD